VNSKQTLKANSQSKLSKQPSKKLKANQSKSKLKMSSSASSVAASSASSVTSVASPVTVATVVTVATDATYATYIKELMAKMSDEFNTKKEIDNFYKMSIKAVKEKIKDENKGTKKKRVKKADDEDDVEKVKKPPNAYQIFLKENRKTVKEENPELTGKECTALLRTMWSKHKEDNA
jgi:hypothetical protein